VRFLSSAWPRKRHGLISIMSRMRGRQKLTYFCAAPSPSFFDTTEMLPSSNDQDEAA
jgi:hypothetical protein